MDLEWSYAKIVIFSICIYSHIICWCWSNKHFVLMQKLAHLHPQNLKIVCFLSKGNFSDKFGLTKWDNKPVEIVCWCKGDIKLILLYDSPPALTQKCVWSYARIRCTSDRCWFMWEPYIHIYMFACVCALHIHSSNSKMFCRRDEIFFFFRCGWCEFFKTMFLNLHVAKHVDACWLDTELIIIFNMIIYLWNTKRNWVSKIEICHPLSNY